MKEKEIILSSDNLTFEDEEVGSSGYSDGLLLYSYHAWMETNVVEVSAAGDIEGDVDIPSEVIINKIKSLLSTKNRQALFEMIEI